MNNLTQSPLKKMKKEEPKESGATINDVPILAFEKILSYLDLEDRIKARAVSGRWCKITDNLRVKSLCFSGNSDELLPYGRWRLDHAVFAQNFIRSRRFEAFFDTFAESILSGLKHLRFVDFDLHENNKTAFARTINSFSLLEELDLIRVNDDATYNRIALELNLPVLNSIQLEDLHGIRKFTLDAPRLQKVRLWKFGNGLISQVCLF